MSIHHDEKVLVPSCEPTSSHTVIPSPSPDRHAATKAHTPQGKRGLVSSSMWSFPHCKGLKQKRKGVQTARGVRRKAEEWRG